MLEQINETLNNYLPGVREYEISDEDVLSEIGKLKTELKDEVFILGHHYQQDEVIEAIIAFF